MMRPSCSSGVTEQEGHSMNNTLETWSLERFGAGKAVIELADLGDEAASFIQHELYALLELRLEAAARESMEYEHSM